MMRAPLALLLTAIALIAISACAKPERKLADTVFVVLPEADGTVGAVTIDDGRSELTLSDPYAAAEVDKPGSLRGAFVTDDQIETIFGVALANEPIPPRDFILYFELGKDVLTAESQAAFEAVFADIARRVAPSIEVTGHTDTLGRAESNRELSDQRSDMIRRLLIAREIDPDSIKAVGRGEIDPLVPTDDDVAEPRNRRVEITVR